MTPEIRAKKDKCTFAVSIDHGKLRVLVVSDEPLIILKGQSLELREAGGQVVVIQRDTPRDAPAPPDPHEDSETGLRGSGGLCGPKGPEGSPPFFSFSTVSTHLGRAAPPPSCPLSDAYLPRRLIVGAAVDDPQRHFATVN